MEAGNEFNEDRDGQSLNFIFSDDESEESQYICQELLKEMEVSSSSSSETSMYTCTIMNKIAYSVCY